MSVFGRKGVSRRRTKYERNETEKKEMKGLTSTDMCFSTIKQSGAFNTDGVSRDCIDMAEARKAFEFEIERFQSFDEIGRPIPGQYHLRKSTDQSFIPSVGVGEKYTPVQHLSVYDFICNDIMPKVPEMKLETVGTLYGSGMGLVTAQIGDDFKLPGDKSPNRIRMFFSNPCNGKGSLILGMTSVRMFCQNQIVAARKDAMSRGGFRVYHTKNANFYVEGALQSIYCQIRLAQDIRNRSERLARIEADTDLVNRVIGRVFNVNGLEEGTRARTIVENRRAEALAQFDGGETAMTMEGKTAWTLFNSMTYPVFNPSNMRKSTDEADIAYRGMAGTISDKIVKWFDIVEQEALSA